MSWEIKSGGTTRIMQIQSATSGVNQINTRRNFLG